MVWRPPRDTTSEVQAFWRAAVVDAPLPTPPLQMPSKQVLITLAWQSSCRCSISLRRDRIQEEVRMGSNGIITGINRQDWLEPAEDRLQKLLHETFASGGRGGQKIKNVLHGTWLGHPLHVILTDVPI